VLDEMKRKTLKEGMEEQNELSIATASSRLLDKGFLISACTAWLTPPHQNLEPCQDAWANAYEFRTEQRIEARIQVALEKKLDSKKINMSKQNQNRYEAVLAFLNHQEYKTLGQTKKI
jgi:hypothetical protein